MPGAMEYPFNKGVSIELFDTTYHNATQTIKFENVTIKNTQI